MSTSIADLAVNLSANIAGFEGDLGKAFRSASKFAKGATASFAVVGAAFASMSSIVLAGTKQAIDRMDDLQAAAKRVGVSSEALSALGYAAQQANVPMAALESAMSRLAKTAGAAMQGPGKERNVFEQIGISVQELQSLRPEQLLVRIADRVSQFKDGTAKSAFAMELFGRGARNMMPLLVEGGAGIEALMERAADLGVVLDDKTTAAADRFNDALNDVKMLQQGLFNDIAKQTMPMLTALADVFVEQGIAARKAGEDSDYFATTLELLLKFAIGVKSAFEIVGKLLGAFAATVVEVADVVWGKLKAFGSAAKDLMSDPIKYFAEWDEQHRKLNESSGDVAARLSGIWSGFADDFGRDVAESAEQMRALDVRMSDAAATAQTAGRNFGTLDAPIAAIAVASKEASEALKEWTKAQAQHDKEMLKQEKIAKDLRDAQAALKASYDALLADYATEAELLSMTEEQRRMLIPLLEAEARVRDIVNEARQKGIAISKEEEAQMIANAKSAAALNVTMGESLAQAQPWADAWQGAMDSCADAFAEFVTGGIDSFKDFGKALLDIGRQYLAQLIRLFMTTRLPALQQGGIAQSGGSFGGMGGLTGGMSGMQDFGAGLGFVGMGASAGYNYTGDWGGAAAGGVLGLGAYGFASGAAGALASGAGVVGAGGAFSAGAAGAMSVLGPVGIALAALAVLYLALSKEKPPAISVIGDDVVGTSGYRNLSPGSTYESALGGFTFASIDSVDRETRDEFAAAIQSFDNSIAQFLDNEQLTRVTAALATFNVHLEEGAITAENLLGARFETILGTFDEGIQEIVRGAGDLEAQIQKLGELLAWPRAIEGILEALGREDMLASMTELERETYLVNERFDAARDALEAMNATEAQITRLEEYRTNALERLGDAQDGVLRNERGIAEMLDGIEWDFFLEGLEGVEREIAIITRQTDDWIRQLMEMGASEEELARVRAIGAARIARLREEEATLPSIYDAMNGEADTMRGYFDNLRAALGGVRDWLSDQPFGTSSASPEERMGLARDDLVSLAQRAARGDIDAINQITGAGDRFLQESAGYYGVGSADFARDEAFVRSLLEPLGAAADATSLSEAMLDLTEVLVRLTALLNRQGVNDPVASALLRVEEAVKSGNATVARALDKAAQRGARVV